MFKNSLILLADERNLKIMETISEIGHGIIFLCTPNHKLIKSHRSLSCDTVRREVRRAQSLLLC